MRQERTTSGSRMPFSGSKLLQFLSSMNRLPINASLFAGALLLFAGWNDPASAADKKYTIALIPGLTTDAFYITMQKMRDPDSKAMGLAFVFQGGSWFY